MDRTQKIIDRVNKYLSLTRYQYSSQEKLSRLNILNDYYSSIPAKASEEIFTSDIQMAEQLTGTLILPLKVRGVFLTEGRPAVKYYSKEELQKAADNPINWKFPLCLDHKDGEISSIIGAVDKIEYDESIKGLRWYGHINSDVYARNVMDNVIKFVSVTVFSSSEQNGKFGMVGKDLTFKELSLVWAPVCKDAYVEVDNA